MLINGIEELIQLNLKKYDFLNQNGNNPNIGNINQYMMEFGESYTVQSRKK